jgi:hypothetical protein
VSCRLPAAGSARRWAVCIAAVLLAACGLHIAVLRIRAERHSSEAERSYKMLWSLYERRPPDASKQEWEHSVSFLVISHMNVFVDPFHGSYDALRRFGDQLDAKLKDPIDRSIVEWVWDRMAETSPQGTQYIERFRPEFRQGVEACRRAYPP